MYGCAGQRKACHQRCPVKRSTRLDSVQMALSFDAALSWKTLTECWIQKIKQISLGMCTSLPNSWNDEVKKWASKFLWLLNVKFLVILWTHCISSPVTVYSNMHSVTEPLIDGEDWCISEIIPLSRIVLMPKCWQRLCCHFLPAVSSNDFKSFAMNIRSCHTFYSHITRDSAESNLHIVWDITEP